MNYDRLLTRVYDKQEKKMWYAGSKYGQITNEGFYGLSGHVFIPFGDRFVPMLCSGRRDKNKKLIYDGDVIDCLGNNCKRTVALSDGCWVVKCTQGGYFEDRDYELSLWDSLDSKNDEIIGNIHENEGA